MKYNLFALLSIIMSIIVLKNQKVFQEQCPYNTNSQCGKHFVLPNLKKWVLIDIIDCICLFIQFLFLIHRVTYIAIPLIGVLQVYYLYINTEQVMTVRSYVGAANIVHVTFFLGFCLIYGIVISSIKLFKYSKKVFAIVFIIIGVLFLILSVNSCSQF